MFKGGIEVKRRAVIFFTAVMLVFSSFNAFADEKKVVSSREEYDGYYFETEYVVLDSTEYKMADEINKAVEVRINAGKEEIAQWENDFIEYVPPMELSYIADGEVYENESFISYVLTSHNYTGGAHGYYWNSTFVGNKAKDKVIKFSGIFKKPIYLYARDFKPMIMEKINEAPECYYPEVYDTLLKLSLENKFYIDENGKVIVYFNPYEIAPYAA